MTISAVLNGYFHFMLNSGLHLYINAINGITNYHLGLSVEQISKSTSTVVKYSMNVKFMKKQVFLFMVLIVPFKSLTFAVLK